MSAALLDNLKSDEFFLEIGYLLPPAALRHRLLATRQVQQLREAIADGTLWEEAVRGFVASLMGDLRRGERFPYELALAALAAALQEWPSAFAEEYLQQLARLELAEMSTSIRVARECLKHRTALAEAVPEGSPSPAAQ